MGEIQKTSTNIALIGAFLFLKHCFGLSLICHCCLFKDDMFDGLKNKVGLVKLHESYFTKMA
ncbi:hypothetical protein A7456_07205 [Moraxella nonliquefaciens]|uniref:Uncharacterized protein n=1 Tax=Moraxella nonliquefaciens TaxID=478 RepID=A0A1B8QHA5_MORNO|nr:hypothetical protein A7456_07205 [Moraxella nonliquefaciens]